MSQTLPKCSLTDLLDRSFEAVGPEWIWFGHAYQADDTTIDPNAIENSMDLIGKTWVWYLASIKTESAFARALSLIEAVDTYVANAVYAYCRSH